MLKKSVGFETLGTVFLDLQSHVVMRLAVYLRCMHALQVISVTCMPQTDLLASVVVKPSKGESVYRLICPALQSVNTRSYHLRRDFVCKALNALGARQ